MLLQLMCRRTLVSFMHCPYQVRELDDLELHGSVQLTKQQSTVQSPTPYTLRTLACVHGGQNMCSCMRRTGLPTPASHLISSPRAPR